MSNYREILRELIANKNLAKNSTNAIATTPMEQPRNEWDLATGSRSIGNIASNFLRGYGEDKEQVAKYNAQLGLPDNLQKLLAVNEIGGKDLLSAMQKQEELSQQRDKNAFDNDPNNLVKQALIKEDVKKYTELAPSLIAAKNEYAQIYDKNSKINKEFEKTSSLLQEVKEKKPVEYQKFIKYLELIGQNSDVSGPVAWFNSARGIPNRIGSVDDAAEKAGIHDKTLINAVKKSEQLVSQLVDKFRLASGDSSAKLVDTPAEVQARIKQARGYIYEKGYQRENLINLFRPIYHNNQQVYSNILKRNPFFQNAGEQFESIDELEHNIDKQIYEQRRD